MKTVGLTLLCLLWALSAIVACGEEHVSTTADAVEWGYNGPAAPGNWASLSAEYATCTDGEQQSPVDITAYEAGDVGPISFSYASEATAVWNDGKLVYVDYPPGNTLKVGQQTFELKSAHLHSPSEHRIDGVSFEAELHLIHADADGNLAVAAVLFRLGEPSPAVQAILDIAPKAGDTVSNGIKLDASVDAAGKLGYYHYDGSKTTPPCDEPVSWYVLREIKTVSPEQVDALLALSGGPNNRPVQPTGSRVIVIGGVP